MSSSETSSITSSSSSSTGLDSDSYGLSTSSSSSSSSSSISIGSDSDKHKKRKSKHKHRHKHKHKHKHRHGHKSKKHRSKHQPKRSHKHLSTKNKRSSSATRKKDKSSRSRRSDKKVSKRSQSARRVKAVKLGSSSKIKKDKLALLIPKDNDEKEEKEKKIEKEKQKKEKEQKEKEKEQKEKEQKEKEQKEKEQKEKEKKEKEKKEKEKKEKEKKEKEQKEKEKKEKEKKEKEKKEDEREIKKEKNRNDKKKTKSKRKQSSSSPTSTETSSADTSSVSSSESDDDKKIKKNTKKKKMSSSSSTDNVDKSSKKSSKKKKKEKENGKKKEKEKKKNNEIEITKESKKSKDKKKKRPFQYHETELQEGTKLFRECEEWVIEVGREGADPTEFDKVQNIQYFFDKFYGNEYMLVGIINEISGHHLVLAQELANKNETEFLVLIINENKNQLLTIKKKELDLKFYSSNKTEKALKKMFLKYDKEAKGEVKIVDMDYEDEESSILEMENATIHTTFKVGVLCIKEGQKKEEEFFQNRYESYDFKQFLKILGEKIRLKGFKKYGGRLDTKEDADGTHAIYSQYKNNQIMYHVLTWLPFDKIDDQQVCRKRHIGNDNVVIVFIEGNVKFLPKSITSQQNHVVIAVRAEHPPLEPDKTLYRVEVARKNTVEDFKPYLPNPPIFREEELRDFLLSKIVSGDRTIQRSGIFQRRMMNFRKEQILDIFESYEEK
ncbi:gtpase-activating rap/ran-gap domain-like protein [Anaeramoeba flamelloides]|uniref:Gtpase-activating rap/ran-gap domain-like protein n=1 Tax=Anaeramoeba flamelloides TaxID=1746091 RepID=A0ABQ8XLM0_9EUKA|nr:gtpase-activating rap/ran-gap domain-like protein [Anaeramoeba flamelloides]